MKAGLAFWNDKAGAKGQFAGRGLVSLIATTLIVDSNGCRHTIGALFDKAIDLLINFFISFQQSVQQVSLMSFLLQFIIHIVL